MTTNPDGTGTCDRCGRHLPNSGVGYCVVICGMTTDGVSWYGHLCTIQPDPCVVAVLDADGLGHRVAVDKLPEFFSQELPG